MKEKTFDTPNKMHFDSSFKSFDKQTNYIGTGNVWASTQFSSYIRPWNEVKNGGYIGNPGDFCKYDMQHFRNVPDNMRSIILDKNRTESVILYEFFFYNNHREREVIGYVLTDKYYKYIEHYVDCYSGWWTKSYAKRKSAINECMKYICA